MKKINLIAALAALLLLSTFATGQTKVPLNTGYNHSMFNPYPTVNINPSPAGARDNYWINIASYPATVPSVDRAWVLRNPGWAPALSDTNWISARNTAFSAAGINQDNPAYTIFRKCFCLLPGYKDAKLNILAMADDTIQIWLNSQVNQVLAPSWGNLNGPPLPGGTTKGFRVGKNCLYVLLEDYFGGAMGFDLQGEVSAFGLLPMPAAGTGQSFEPCACRSEGPTVAVGAVSAKRVDDTDRQVISEIVKIAEARRVAKQRRLYQGQPTPLKVSPRQTDPTKQPND
jgi:hypothetical protein